MIILSIYGSIEFSMNRTERLLNLLQIMRSYRYPVSGERLAKRLGVSIRTLYRDIATLQAQGAEIEGEVGVGYVLKPSYFLPPLMFSLNEIHAMLLGVQWVSQYGDAPLAKSAVDALNKIFDVLPANVKSNINAYSLRVGPPASEELATEDLSLLREAIAKQERIHVITSDSNKKRKADMVWPFTIGYFTDKRILAAWSETENGFRLIDTHELISYKLTGKQYTRPRDSLFREWQAEMMSRIKQRK